MLNSRVDKNVLAVYHTAIIGGVERPVRASLATMPAYLAENSRTTRDTLAGSLRQRRCWLR